ncbi:MAG: hypothetical protein HFI63_08685 [Lachnospiraceae bacterium]|nr:hypothetical protein [Lachnospiraceae bacterium]
MKISKKVRRWCIPALAALFMVPCLNLLRTQAAGGIEVDRPCRLTISVDIGVGSGGSNAEYLEDFNRMSIPVSVYRVADVDVSGQNYTPTEPFGSLDFTDLSSDHQAESTAARWQDLAQSADRIRAEVSPEEAGRVTLEKEEGSSDAAQGEITGLRPGMYLVVPEASYNPDYSIEYTFTPYLTALPSSAYTLGEGESEEWIYDTKIGLKPDAVPKVGRLNITKILKEYNETLGPATFVFHVVGVDGNGVTKYEEVASLTFHAAGSDTITLEGIPAGLTVTVTEVYSGASYTVEGSASDSALVWSGEAVSAGISGEASVTFTNRYDGGNRGGYGVTNHFESDGEGGWTWENPTTPPED